MIGYRFLIFSNFDKLSDCVIQAKYCIKSFDHHIRRSV